MVTCSFAKQSFGLGICMINDLFSRTRKYSIMRSKIYPIISCMEAVYAYHES